MSFSSIEWQASQAWYNVLPRFASPVPVLVPVLSCALAGSGSSGRSGALCKERCRRTAEQRQHNETATHGHVPSKGRFSEQLLLARGGREQRSMAGIKRGSCCANVDSLARLPRRDFYSVQGGPNRAIGMLIERYAGWCWGAPCATIFRCSPPRELYCDTSEPPPRTNWRHRRQR